MKLYASPLSELEKKASLCDAVKKAANRRYAEACEAWHALQPHAKPQKKEDEHKEKYLAPLRRATNVAFSAYIEAIKAVLAEVDRIQRGEAQEITESGRYAPEAILRTGIQPEGTVLVISERDWRIA